MKPLDLGKHRLVWGAKTYIMGIINVTPDSFSGDGLGSNVAAAIEQAKRFAGEGADMLDVGGESTRPGAAPVSEEEEIRRVVPVIEGCIRVTDLPISVDTSKAAVARAALEAGATIVNDVWGFRADPAMATVCAQAGCPVILMHNRRTPPQATRVTSIGGHYAGLVYEDVMAEIIAELRECMSIATTAGVQLEHIILDPGLGFAKTAEHNLEVMRRLGDLKTLGRPILVGPSRKSTIGLVLNLPVDQRVEGTAALVALAIAAGADMVRVHDVLAMARVARMTDAVVRGWTRP